MLLHSLLQLFKYQDFTTPQEKCSLLLKQLLFLLVKTETLHTMKPVTLRSKGVTKMTC